MPLISTFYGIAIYMYHSDAMKHHRPHIHAEYGEFSAVFAIDRGDVIRGELPRSQARMVQAWIEIHRRELVYNWSLAVGNAQPHKIDPLK